MIWKRRSTQSGTTKEERRANAAAWMRGEYGPAGYTYGVSKLVTGLMVLGGVLYLLTPWALVVCLGVAFIAMVGRLLIERQAGADFSDLHEAKRQFERTGRHDYLDFIQARGNQMLSDNKALRPTSKAEINELLQWADRYDRKASTHPENPKRSKRSKKRGASAQQK
jgi:hypothetical protein